MNYILDEFSRTWVTPSQYDYLLSKGWRHFGENFFRYNISIYEEKVCNVIPLRIKVDQFMPSKSQRKIIKKCENFEISIQKINIDNVTENLFDLHKLKFTDNIPNSIYDFISKSNPSNAPTTILELIVYDNGKAIAISYFGIGESSISSIYAMFNPDYKKYSLGLFTMLVEINYATQLDMNFYYHGYCYDISSFYDYKKKFNALEGYNWNEDKWEIYSSFDKEKSMNSNNSSS